MISNMLDIIYLICKILYISYIFYTTLLYRPYSIENVRYTTLHIISC